MKDHFQENRLEDLNVRYFVCSLCIQIHLINRETNNVAFNRKHVLKLKHTNERELFWCNLNMKMFVPCSSLCTHFE